MAIMIDGQYYNSADEAPDLGSLTAVDVDKDNSKIRSYEGLLSDLSKLPHYV